MLSKFNKIEIFSYKIFEIELLETVSSQPLMDVEKINQSHLS